MPSFRDECFRERAGIEDDSIPSAYLSEIDQGLYEALIGGDVRFLCDTGWGWISSMVPPVLPDWGELDGSSFDAHHPWFRHYQEYLDLFVLGAEGSFGISHFILISGLNFVFELVGATETYLALTAHGHRATGGRPRLFHQRGRPATLFREGPVTGRRHLQQHGAMGSGTHRLRKRRSLPHDIGRMLRALGPRKPRADLRSV